MTRGRIFERNHSVDTMFRRSFLGALSTVSVLPVIPNRLDPARPLALPSEGSLMFWFHFYSAIDRDRPMSTDRARRMTVDELDLDTLDDDEAVRLLELANDGAYGKHDMPKQWQGVFDELRRDF